MKCNERDNFVQKCYFHWDFALKMIGIKHERREGRGNAEKKFKKYGKRNWKRNGKKRKKESMIGKNRNHDGIHGTRRHEADM